jgi:hypothetical protein
MRSMQEKMSKLQSSVDQAVHAKWIAAIARLNGAHDAPVCPYCNPPARMRIVGDPGNEVWRCSANNHGTHGLNSSQRKRLP